MSLEPFFLIGSAGPAADRFHLPEEIVPHLKARRLRPGDRIALGDGGGGIWEARLCRLDGRAAEASLLSFRRADPPRPVLEMYPALFDLGRMDFLVEKATELGVKKIQPVRSRRSARVSISASRLSRWRRIAASACGQCRNPFLPEILEPVDWETSFRKKSAGDLSLVAWERSEGKEVAEFLRRCDSPPSRIRLWIGPEGGLVPAEVEQARAAGCGVVGLGPRLLRSETAALFLLSCFRAFFPER